MQSKSGLWYGITAYVLWGLFPIYFGLLQHLNALEVIPWRVIACLGFCVILLLILRQWSELIQILRKPKQLLWFLVSGVLLYINWQLYVYGVLNGLVLETSLGYFINPIVTVLFGVLIWRERLSRIRWIALAVVTVGVLVGVIVYGEFPAVALGLAFSFGSYGAIRKAMKTNTTVVTGLTLETVAVLPLALLQLLLLAQHEPLRGFSTGTVTALVVIGSGVVTAVPLLCFSDATARLPLSYLGFIQFIGPMLIFIYGWLVLAEPMGVARWISFGAVWVAASLLLFETLQRHRRNR